MNLDKRPARFTSTDRGYKMTRGMKPLKISSPEPLHDRRAGNNEEKLLKLLARIDGRPPGGAGALLQGRFLTGAVG